MKNLIGELIGRYRITDELGRGGMAVVYKAIDTILERKVAIKMILPDQQQTDKYLKRFNREARSLAQLSHASIVKILDYGDYEGIPYLVMEYISGGSLSSEKYGNLSAQKAASILAPIARALHYSHQRKIIHRDIKPANILFNEAGQPVLADFGIAKLTESDESQSLTGTGMTVGTPEYMSPEQIQGKLITGKSDIYSLGVVFFEMVTGRKPYKANTPVEIALKHMNEPTPRSKQFNREIPHDADQVIFKAMAKKPEERFQDMEAFAAALEKISGTPSTGERRVVKAEPVKESPSLTDRLVFLKNLSPRLRYSLIGGMAVLVIAIIALVVILPGGNTKPNAVNIPDPTETVEIVEPTKPKPVAVKLPTKAPQQPTAQPSSETSIDSENQAASANQILPENAGKVINLEKKDKTSVIKLFWSPDGQWIINVGGKALRIIKPEGMATSATIDLKEIPKDIVVSPDSKNVFVLLGKSIQGFDLNTKKEIANFPLVSTGGNSITISPDQKILAVGITDNKVQLVDSSSGSSIRLLRSYFGGWSVAFSPDGKLIAAGTSKGVLMWEVETGAWLPILSGQNDIIKSLVFSHDGKYLAGGAENSIFIWDTSSGSEVKRFTGNFGFINGLAFSPNDQLITTGSTDMIVRLWDLNGTNKPQELKKHGSPIVSLTISPTGEKIASGDYGNIFIWGLP